MAISLSPKSWKRLALIYFIFITAILFWPGNAFPETRLVTIPYFDKLIHVILFTGLSGLMLKAYYAGNASRTKFILGFIILYGILTEFIQLAFIPFRSFDLFDIVADITGTFAGTLFLRLKRF